MSFSEPYFNGCCSSRRSYVTAYLRSPTPLCRDFGYASTYSSFQVKQAVGAHRRRRKLWRSKSDSPAVAPGLSTPESKPTGLCPGCPCIRWMQAIGCALPALVAQRITAFCCFTRKAGFRQCLNLLQHLKGIVLEHTAVAINFAEASLIRKGSRLRYTSAGKDGGRRATVPFFSRT